MQITRQADYAIRAVRYLAKQGPNQRSATSTVAQEMKIPPSFLAKIISQLSIAGLLHTSRGARGGVTLAREPRTFPCSKLSRPSTGRSCSTNVLAIPPIAISMTIAWSTRSG